MVQLDRLIMCTGIAYSSMEIAPQPEMHTYASLGALAGETARSKGTA